MGKLVDSNIYSWFLTNNLIKDVYITNIILETDCDCFFELSSKFTKLHSGDILFLNIKIYSIILMFIEIKNMKNRDIIMIYYGGFNFIKTYGAL